MATPGSVWERLVADSATAHRRLDELGAAGAAARGDDLGELLARAAAASSAARDHVRTGAGWASALNPGTGLDVPHDARARARYEDLGTLVESQRNLTYRASLLTVPSAPSEQRSLVSGLRRAVTDLEGRTVPKVAPMATSADRRVGRPSGPD